MVSLILVGSGGTIRLNSDLPLPSTGFYVGGSARGMCEYMGWWVDEVTGLTHLDWVNWYVNREAAVAIGRMRGEIAIFDVAGDCEVRL